MERKRMLYTNKSSWYSIARLNGDKYSEGTNINT